MYKFHLLHATHTNVSSTHYYAEQFVFLVLEFQEFYKEKCMSHTAVQPGCVLHLLHTPFTNVSSMPWVAQPKGHS